MSDSPETHDQNAKILATAPTSSAGESFRGTHHLLGRLGTRIGLAFGLVAVVVTVSTVVTVWHVNEIAETIQLVREQRHPTAEASLKTLSGINMSLAELRGWILLGTPQFKERRAKVWDETITASLERLSELAVEWSNDAERQRLAAIRARIFELRELQDQLESLAHTRANQPAHQILIEEATPLAGIMTDGITAIIDAEKTYESSFERKRLMANMADFRASMAIGKSHIRAFLLSADDQFRISFSSEWAKNERAFRALMQNQELFTAEQAEAFAAIRDARRRFSGVADRMFQIRAGPEWNRANYSLATRAAPLADEVRQRLNELVDDQQRLIDDAQSRARRQVATLHGIQWLLFIFGVTASIFLGVILTRTAAQPIEQAVKMAEQISAGNLEYRSDIRGSVEAEALGRSLTRMAESLAAFIQQTEVKQMRLAVEAASNGMVMVDSHGKIVLVNKRMEEIFGYSRKELVGQPVEVFLPGHMHQRHVQDRTEFMRNPKVYRMGEGRDLYAIHKSGRPIPVEVGLTPIHSESGMSVLATVADITERKRAETALKQANERLNRSNQELEQFAYVASHDLQEPLRKISSFCSILAEDYREHLDEDGETYINYVVDGVARMTTLIQDLLTFSRVETKGREFTRVAVSRSLQDALDNLDIAIEESGAIITTDDMPTVRADEIQFTQLFQNLIGNAIKYRGQATPEIHVRVREQGDDWEFSVADNGIGIPKEFQDRIFGIFKRLHGRDEYSGTGIGLAICKRIVERFHGRIWVESQEGEGSTFLFTIPKSNSDSHKDETNDDHFVASQADTY